VKPTPIGTLGTRLRVARLRAKLGQKQLEAETGVLQSRISELENDKRTNIDVWDAHALCKRLGITVEYLGSTD
jgi:transcriptional regulator with XRE-family HTH domain